VRLEELQAQFERAEAESDARDIGMGSLFKLTEHPNDAQNREYLIIASEYRVNSPGFDAGGAIQPGTPEPTYAVRFTAQPSNLPFRPERITPRPFIPGPHAAVVVGDGEIWTDKYGRVKILFPWDHLGKDKSDGSGSCWARVAQVWAGGSWGGIHIPRVGQEVIVEFIEGDPDRPIVTGRVYNGANLPPYELPAQMTKSGILSRSSKGGSADNANEFRFEDKKGDEQLFLHAEKNMDTEVEHDQTLWVGHDRTKTVDNDQNETVKGNKAIQVNKNHTEKIDENMTLEVV
jgi:type VI secretion system secreted protein VgrG